MIKEKDKTLPVVINDEDPIHSSDVCRKIISAQSTNKIYPTSQITSLSDEQDNDLDPLETSGGTNNFEINR